MSMPSEEGDLGWLSNMQGWDVRKIEQMVRQYNWKPGSMKIRDMLVDGLYLFAMGSISPEEVAAGVKPPSVREKLAAARLIALFNAQNLEALKLILAAAARDGGSGPVEFTPVNLGEHEKRAHIEAILEQAVKDGLIEPPERLTQEVLDVTAGNASSEEAAELRGGEGGARVNGSGEVVPRFPPPLR